MDVQNISGPDVVQNSPTTTYDTTQQTEVSQTQTEVVSDEQKGQSFDSYA